MKLKSRQIETAKPKEKTYKLADDGGLYLEVTPRGSKYWRMKYRRPIDKKEDRLAFGVYPTISLADARTKRDEAKKLLSKGVDPTLEQKGHNLNQWGHLRLGISLVSSIVIINGGVRVIKIESCVVLSNIFSTCW